MDTSKPELIWVGGRCYRFVDIRSDAKHLVPYEASEIPIKLEQKWNDYVHSFSVDSNYYGLIIGNNGETVKKLQRHSRTSIKFLRKRDIVITGYTQKDVEGARRRIDIMIAMKKGLDFTHFLSIPSKSEELKNNFEKFKQDLLSKYGNNGVKGISEGSFQTPAKFHLTLAMLVLLDKEDHTRTVENLKACEVDIIQPILEREGPITIEFEGVENMSNDPKKVNILSFRIRDERGCLERISNDIKRRFLDEGLAPCIKQTGKLHLTVMNTRFLHDDTGTGKYDKEAYEFDATEILEEYRNWYFGKISFSTIHLCQKNAKSDDGEYPVEAKIEFS